MFRTKQTQPTAIRPSVSRSGISTKTASPSSRKHYDRTKSQKLLRRLPTGLKKKAEQRSLQRPALRLHLPSHRLLPQHRRSSPWLVRTPRSKRSRPTVRVSSSAHPPTVEGNQRTFGMTRKRQGKA